MQNITDWEDVPMPKAVKADPITDWADVSAESEATPETSKLESFGRGGAQGLSFGFADELTGALESMFTDKKYEQARDESRLNYDKAKESNPKTFMAGEITGAIAPTLVAPEAAAINTVKGMAGLGAVTALGHSEADLTKGDVKGALKDTARGAVEGVVAHGVGKGLQAAGENLLPALKKLATEGGESALGIGTGAIKKMPGGMGGVETAEDVANFALKNTPALEGKSIVTPGSNTRAMWEKASTVRDAAGSDIGGVLDAMDKNGKVPQPILEEIYGAISKEKNRLSEMAGDLGDTAIAQYRKAEDAFLKHATNPEGMSFEKLGEFKKVIGDIAYKHGSPLESKAALQDVYTAVNSGLEKAVDTVSNSVGNTELPVAYKAAKKAYDMSLRAIDALEGKAAKEAGGKWVGFGDVMAGGLGSTIGGVPGMIAAVGAKRAIEARGAQTIGKVSHTLAEKLETALTKNPQILGKYLPMLQQAHSRGQLAATNYVLQQRDPEYAETLKKLDQVEEGQ